MRLGTSKITMKYISCGWEAGGSYSSPRTEAKSRSPYLVNERIVNSVNILLVFYMCTDIFSKLEAYLKQ